MPTLPEIIVTLLLPFEHPFDPRTWRKAQLLVVGSILSPGKRTVSSALNILGVGQQGDFTIYPHVLSRARWSPLQPSLVLMLLVAGRLGPSKKPWFSALTRPWNGAGGGRSRPRSGTGIPYAHKKPTWLPRGTSSTGESTWSVLKARC